MWTKPKAIGVALGGRKGSWKDIDPGLNGISSSPMVNDLFVMQKYGGRLPRHRYRIMLAKSYRIAVANTLEELVSECWLSLLELANQIPSELDRHGKIKWIIIQIDNISKNRKKIMQSTTETSQKSSNSGSEEEMSDFEEDDSSFSSPASSPKSSSNVSHTPSPVLMELPVEQRTPETKETENEESESEETKKGEEKQQSQPSSKISDESSTEKQTEEDLEELPLVYFLHQLGIVFSEDATREQRTTKYLLISFVFVTTYSFILRYTSFDLFLLFLVLLLAGVAYVIKDRNALIMKAAKRKVKRVVRTEKKKWFG